MSTETEQGARDWICRACGVESRREIDHSAEARAQLWNIGQRFKAWKAKAGQEAIAQ